MGSVAKRAIASFGTHGRGGVSMRNCKSSPSLLSTNTTTKIKEIQVPNSKPVDARLGAEIRGSRAEMIIPVMANMIGMASYWTGVS